MSSTHIPVTDKPFLHHGAAWYPEQWDEAIILQDVRLMNELGLDAVRLGEFSWSCLEPQEGKLDLKWLEKALDLLDEHRIGAVIGTPTPTPPQWLLKKHPEIGYQEPDGYQHRHGARQHACYNNEIFRAHSRRITEVVARAFGKHPAVIAWQTDNEFRGHQKICICPACAKRWATWLKNRYASIDELNAAWSTQVWSNRYVSFEDVPQPYRVCCWSHHFSVLINYRRFMSDSVIDFQREQLEIIRAHSAAPVTHNSEDSVDEYDLTRDLDFASADIYLHYASPSVARLRLDCMRHIKASRRFWTIETGSDPLLFSRMLPKGWLACFAFLNFTSGSQSFFYWPWRQHRGGTEIDHTSILYANGQPTPSWDNASGVSSLIQTLDPIMREYSPASADVAMIRSETNGHYFFTDLVAGLEPNFSYRTKLAGEYASLTATGAWRDVVFDEAPLTGYKVIFSPYLPYASPKFLQSMESHLAAGGTWVIGPYCGYRDRDHTVPTNALFGQVEKMIGFKTKYFCPGGEVNVSLPDGIHSRASMYVTVFDPAPTDEVLGRYEDSRFLGEAWGLVRRHGNGRVYILGSELEAQARTRLYAHILDREKIERAPQPDRVWLCPQKTADGRTGWAVSNWDETPHKVLMPRPGRDLLTGRTVQDKLIIQPCTNAFIAFD